MLYSYQREEDDPVMRRCYAAAVSSEKKLIL